MAQTGVPNLLSQRGEVVDKQGQNYCPIMSQRSFLNVLLCPRCGGTAGAILTCPLEVVKTRLQSSQLALRPLCLPEIQLPGMSVRLMNPTPPSPGVLQLLRAILEKEGVRSLFRGLGPNLAGVAPSRAIYFAAYSGVKERLNTVLVPESKKVHILAAACAGEPFLSQIKAKWSFCLEVPKCFTPPLLLL